MVLITSFIFPHRAMVYRPGHANCAPNGLGAAFAMEGEENKPKSLRFGCPDKARDDANAKGASKTRTKVFQ